MGTNPTVNALMAHARHRARDLDGVREQKRFWRLVVESAMAEWTRLDAIEDRELEAVADARAAALVGQRAERER